MVNPLDISVYVDDLLTDLIRDYTGEPLGVVLLGGGTFLLNLALYPGASKVLGWSTQLYSTESQNDYCIVPINEHKRPNSVSREWLTHLKTCGQLLPTNVLIMCSAALHTTRPRRGDDHAWIHYSDSKGDAWLHMDLVKMEEREDDSVAAYRLAQEKMLLATMVHLIRYRGQSSPWPGNVLEFEYRANPVQVPSTTSEEAK